MLKRKIIPAFLVSVLAISATAGVSAEAFSENAYAAEELHTGIRDYREFRTVSGAGSSDGWRSPCE